MLVKEPIHFGSRHFGRFAMRWNGEANVTKKFRNDAQHCVFLMIPLALAVPSMGFPQSLLYKWSNNIVVTGVFTMTYPPPTNA